MMKLSTKFYSTPSGEQFNVHYRPGTSDERVLTEVVDKHCYRRKRIDFDVEPGEHWLDLGANIGAFAVYCRTRGATASGYEPDAMNFFILGKNVNGFEYKRAAVTSSQDAWLPFWKGRLDNDHYRGTVVPSKNLPKHPEGQIPNHCGTWLKYRVADGCKMDVEGSEGGLIDNGMIPNVKKLCIEYHLSRDPSIANLARRLDILRGRFKHVHYPPEFDRLIVVGGEARTFFDRMIWCAND
jgi:hypothetical protein